jgi:lysophospholipase L1-like esterase
MDIKLWSKLCFKFSIIYFCTLFLFACGGESTSSENTPSPVVNSIPIANAGFDQNIEEHNDVFLVGKGVDNDGSVVSYQWTQTAGTTVSLENASNNSANFVAPIVTETELLTFELQVTDNENATDSDSVDITVTPVNADPVSDAGVDQNIDEQNNVYLVGTGVDNDGSVVSYQWTQTAGTTVSLENASNDSANFVAPIVTETELLTFELQVTDNENATDSDSVDITVTPVNEVKVIATDYNFWCSSQTQAVAWYDDTIAIIIEGEDALQFDFEAMSRMISFFHRLYERYESVTGLTSLPLDSPWQNRITIQIPLDNCGAGGLANHGVRGISVGRGLFDEQYEISLTGAERYHQVFIYESNRNFWPPAFNESFDWAMDDEPMSWGWWTVGMNNAMAVMMTDMLGVELEYYGHDAQWFRDRMVANFETYRDNLIYDFDYGWRQHLMPWDPNESINDLMSGLIIHSYETWGGETWLKDFYQYISTVPARTGVFAYQECRDNIYRIWSDAAGEDLSDFFIQDLRWNITVDGIQQVNFKYSLADALAGGNGSFPGTGTSGTSVITSLNNQDFSSHTGIVDGAFVPQNEVITIISTSDLSFDFSEKIGISLHDGIPNKGPSLHTDPSLQTNNLGTNPNYSGDPADHAYIDMHAAAGITYNLQEIKQSFTNDITLNRFTARFGSATGANLNYWVLVDGVEVKYGELVSGNYEAQDVGIALSEENTYLTLVMGDANAGSINNAHGYIGDPILHGVGTKTNTAATPTNPANQSISALAWQPLNWSYELGVNNYDIYLWNESEVQPSDASYNVTSTQLTPYYYLDFNNQYYWQITSNLDNESFTSPIYTFKVSPYDELTAPVYDVSPAAQETRITSYTLNGISQISGSDSNISTGLNIGFYGDSNTDIMVWQGLLVDTLSTLGVTSLNRGINGADIKGLWDGVRNYDAGGGLEEPAPFSEQIIADNVDVAVIYIGINDVLNNNPSTPTADYRSYLSLMVEACVTNNIKVVLVSPTTYNEKPDGSNLYDEQLDQYQVAAQEVAAQWNVSFVAARTHFINYLKNNNFSVQQDGSVIFPYETGLLNSDSVHHNKAGKDLLSDLVAEGLQRVLTPSP